MVEKDDVELIEIFAGTMWQAGMVKSLLENAEIEAYLTDEIMGALYPWYTAPGGAGSIKVFVSSQDFDNAKRIVNDFEKNLKEEK